MPLSRISVRGADGTEYSYDYGSPSDYARQLKEAGITSIETATDAQLKNLRDIQQRDFEHRLTTEANIQRYLRPQTTEEKQYGAILEGQRQAIDKFYEDFPNPIDRDTYVGWLNRRGFDLVQLVHNNPRFALFVQDLEPFNHLDDVQRSLPIPLQTNIIPYVPTGGERYARDFEQHLFDFKNAVSDEQRLSNAANQMPAGQVTDQWANGVRERLRDERMQRATPAEREAMGLPPPPRAQGGEQPPTVQLAPRGQGPITYYGHTAAQ
jgi:hypothetical protein